MTLNLRNVLTVGDITCLATIPFDMEVEAYFLAKEDGIVAGIALAEMIFNEVDPSLKVRGNEHIPYRYICGPFLAESLRN
jgi:nicotinate-nucleotide pyrophosphorylase